MRIPDEYREYATPRQLEYIDAINQTGSYHGAAKLCGVDRMAVKSGMKALRGKCAKQGIAFEFDMTHAVPDGYMVKGVSTYYNADGKPAGQWVKSSVDQVRQMELLKSAIEALSSDIKGNSRPVRAPRMTNKDLLSVYPMGDPHFGMHAWGKECGEDFDLKIARSLTLGAVTRLLNVGPASDTAVILPLGDVLHVNDQTNVTPGHKHQLDADSRFAHIVQVGIQTFKLAIDMALQKHKHIIVRFVCGNHDPSAVLILAHAMAAFYSNNKRVFVDMSPAAHWFYKFGHVLLGSTHGDRSKGAKLAGVMSVDQAENWGLTKYRYWLCGHVHHSSVQEYPGCTVETFRTLAAADAYAMGYGYRAGRDMRCIVYHKDYGEIERYSCDVAMIR